MNATTRTLMIAAATVLLVACQCSAAVWDVATDIAPTATANPNGPWSFGYVGSLGGAFTFYGHYYADAASPGPGTPIHCWDYQDPAGSWRGFVTKNASSVEQNHYGLPIPAGGIGFHPGWSDTALAAPTWATVRWTSPITGGIKINATFTGRSDSGVPDVHVYQKGTIARFDGAVSGSTTTTSPDIYAAVSVGDAIDFLVGWGNGAPQNDYTALTAVIQDGVATGSIAGAVTSEFPGNPGIPGATVTATGAAGSLAVPTNVNGGYELDMLPGAYSVQASAPGYVTSDPVEVTVTANAVVPLSFRLVGGRIEGTVTSSFGQPVEGATVTATGTETYTATTIEDGSYAITCPPDLYAMTASKPSYADDTADVTVTSGVVTDQDFVLEAGRAQGKVTSSATGSPILGAKIIIGDYFAVTGADGNYSLLMPPGDYTAQCRAGGYVAANQPAAISTTSVLTQNYALSAAASVDIAADFNTYANPSGAWSYGEKTALGGPFTLFSGWITEGTDNGLVGQSSYAQVIFNPTGVDDHWMAGDYYVGDFEAGKVVLWPSNGNEKSVARFTVLSAGRYSVSARFSGRYSGGTTTGVHLLKNNALAVSGAVSGFSGTAAMGYGDAFGDIPTATLRGIFDVAADDTIEFAVDNGGDGFGTDGTQLDATILPSTEQLGTLTGQITTCVDPIGIAGVKLRCWSYSDNSQFGAVTDENGNYSLLLPADSYDIEIIRPGYLDPGYQFASISAGQTEVLNVCLSGTAIVGHVRHESPTGAGIPGVTVRTDDDAFSTVTDDLGAYELPIDPGTYNMVASKGGYLLAQQGSVTVEDGVRLTLDFVLVPGPYDVAADFDPNLAANPNGAWTYGRKATPTGDFYESDLRADYGNGVKAWCQYVDRFMTGKCMLSTAPDAFDWNRFNANLEPSRFYMGPGFDDTAAVARWTAPSAGCVQVDATFRGREFLNGTTSDVHVVRGSDSFFDGAINGFSGSALPEPERAAFGAAPTQTYSGVIDVDAGSTIDFIVGTGTDGWTTDFVEVQATLHYTECPAVPCAAIAEAKALADGKRVTVTEAKVVTVAANTFTDGTRYVEEPDRSSGIKVIFSSGAAALGDAITFAGTVKTDANGEKYIDVSSVDSATAATVPGDLGMTNKTALDGQVQGLLITVWGKIIEKDMSQLVLDDGTGVGLRVQLSGLGSPITKTFVLGKTVTVTGPVGFFNEAANVRPRGNDDVVLNN